MIRLMLFLLPTIVLAQTYDCGQMLSSVENSVSSVSSCTGKLGAYTVTYYDLIQMENWRTGAVTSVGSQTTSGQGYCVLTGACGTYPVQDMYESEANSTWKWLAYVTSWAAPTIVNGVLVPCYSTVTTTYGPVSAATVSCPCVSSTCGLYGCPACAPAQACVTPPTSTCCGGFTGGCSETPVCVNESTCTFECENVSPIIINIDGLGWDLTTAQNGVQFNFFGNGPIQMAWTAAGSQNAFLALPRDGAVDNGADLFGNVTPQPVCAPNVCNGFLALGVYDQPANGGNGNGIIDPGDAIWSQLLLWFDLNHDGIAEPNELITLSQWNQQNPAMAVTGFDLHYQTTNYVDPSGNAARFCAPIFGPGAGRITCDWFLKAQ